MTAVRDITARKRQLERHHLLSNIVEETADAVLVTDGLVSWYVNAAFERTTGFSRADVLGENPRLLKSGMHSRNFYEDLWTRLLRGEVYRGTLIDRRKSGEVYLSSQTITPLRTPDGAISHMVSIARDLTGRRTTPIAGTTCGWRSPSRTSCSRRRRARRFGRMSRPTAYLKV